MVGDCFADSPSDRSGPAATITVILIVAGKSRGDRGNYSYEEDFSKALGAKSLEKGVLLLVRAAEGSRFVVIGAESE